MFTQEKGYCRICLVETEEKAYVLCVPCCRFLLDRERELRRMGLYDIDKDVYIKWYEEKFLTIEQMNTRDEIEKRVVELSNIEFFAKAEGKILAERYDKISGRHGIPPWIKADRDKLITDPNIKINWDGEPRKVKPKKEKVDYLALLDINKADLDAQLKGKGTPPQAKPAVEKKKPMSMQDAIALMIAPPEKPPELSEEEKKAKEDEKKAKIEAMKEKMRLIKEGKKE